MKNPKVKVSYNPEFSIDYSDKVVITATELKQTVEIKVDFSKPTHKIKIKPITPGLSWQIQLDIASAALAKFDKLYEDYS